MNFFRRMIILIFIINLLNNCVYSAEIKDINKFYEICKKMIVDILEPDEYLINILESDLNKSKDIESIKISLLLLYDEHLGSEIADNPGYIKWLKRNTCLLVILSMVSNINKSVRYLEIAERYFDNDLINNYIDVAEYFIVLKSIGYYQMMRLLINEKKGLSENYVEEIDNLIEIHGENNFRFIIKYYYELKKLIIF